MNPAALEQLTLQRVRQNDFGTYGEVRDEAGTLECVTIELPWHENAHDISCIPAGTYIAERYYSPKHKCTVFRLLDVPNRDLVELHIANLPEDLLGCI